MGRPKTKNGQKVSYNLDSDLMKRFKEYCDAMGQTQTVAIERMIKQQLDTYDSRKNGNA